MRYAQVLYGMCWKELKAKVKDRVFIFAGHKVVRGCYMTGLIG
jgi:hypothetical protein